MKKTLLAASLAALAALGGCASTQGFGARFQRNLQLDVMGTAGADGAGGNEHLTLPAQGQATQAPVNLSNPGPRDLAAYGAEAASGQVPPPNWNNASDAATQMRLMSVLGHLLDAKKGAELPNATGSHLSFCISSGLFNAICEFNAKTPSAFRVNAHIAYRDGHIALIASSPGLRKLAVIPLY